MKNRTSARSGLAASSLGLALCIAAAGCAVRSTKSSETSFRGRTITIVAPFSAGGASDVLSRLVGQQLGTYLPGKPTVIVKNMVGGSGSVGLRYAAQQAPADGLTVGVVDAGMAIRYLRKKPGFDMLPSVQLLGGFPQGLVEAAAKSLGTDVASVRERTKPVRVAETAAGSTGALAATIGHKLLAIPYQPVYGYSSGGGEAATALLQGQADAAQTADSSFEQTFLPYVRSSKLQPLFQTGVAGPNGNIVRSPLVGNVPTIFELYQRFHDGAKPSGDLWNAYQLLADLNAASDVLVVRQGTPAHTLSVLRAGFQKMISSASWKSFTQQRLTVPFIGSDAATTGRAWKAVLGASTAQVALLKKFSGAG